MADAPIGAEWFDALQHATDTKIDEVPEGWLTVREIAAQTGMSEGHTWKRLRHATKDGRVHRREFMIRTGKVIKRVTHYMLDRCE